MAVDHCISRRTKSSVFGWLEWMCLFVTKGKRRVAGDGSLRPCSFPHQQCNLRLAQAPEKSGPMPNKHLGNFSNFVLYSNYIQTHSSREAVEQETLWY